VLELEFRSKAAISRDGERQGSAFGEVGSVARAADLKSTAAEDMLPSEDIVKGGFQWRTRLVVLSACNSSRGQVRIVFHLYAGYFDDVHSARFRIFSLRCKHSLFCWPVFKCLKVSLNFYIVLYYLYLYLYLYFLHCTYMGSLSCHGLKGMQKMR